MFSGRSAVICEFFCRSEPAAALRGFGVVFLPSAGEPLVQRDEAGQRHVDLAAHLEQRQRLFALRQLHARRDRLDRLQVRRHVLTSEAVAPRRAAHELPVLVDQVDREAVDLRLRHVHDVLGAQPLRHVLVPLLERLVVRDLLERAHRRGVVDLLELVRGAAPTRWVGESGVASSGSCSSSSELVEEPVELRVRDLRLVEDVVTVEVVVDQVAQLGRALHFGPRGRQAAPPPFRRRRRALRARVARASGFDPT